MPKHYVDKDTNKVVVNESFVDDEVVAKIYKAQDVYDWGQATGNATTNGLTGIKVAGGGVTDTSRYHGLPLSDKAMFDGASPPPYPAPFPLDLKFKEDHYIDEIKDYIAKTYEEHYAKGNIQTFELIASSGHADGFTMGSIEKYASRYGKKNGYNRKDLLKIIHYALLQLWNHDNSGREKKKGTSFE